ncbi:hypothetical protein N7474_004336 [Penicillium riverlandense]|uniref:uncharacterized protein n=1 Tax=Penicillium riverlandense TaxID=1903569 RepID=UPI002548163B|nr:uncharacterized protein N7474_004336 [Penicillium riverlandense]KAJ5818745.1 hypothetical protein N7474_004336 [Penicillium riverlandense]
MESSRLDNTGIPAPYGRACHRLSKECRPSQPVRKRTSRRSEASRTAQLEAKLDSLVSMLQSGHVKSKSVANLHTGDSRDAPLSDEARISAHGFSPLYGEQGILSPSTTESAHAQPSPWGDFSSSVSPEEEEQFFNDFRSKSMEYLPIAYIPPHVTSSQFRQEKPFFWFCIMAVSTRDLEKRDALLNKVNYFIYQKIILGVESSLDLLLGLMTYTSWTILSKKPFMNFVGHMIMGLVCELGINKDVPKEQSALHTFKCSIGWKVPAPALRTMEERRAVLGAFLITSSIAVALLKIDALRWTPHMEENLCLLEQEKESPQDELLVTLVRIQLVADKAYNLQRDEERNSAPTAFYVNSLQSQLNTVKRQITPQLQQHLNVLLNLSHTEIIINEASISRFPVLSNGPDLHRIESLYTCLRAAQTWIDVWLSIPPEDYVSCSFLMFFQFSRALVNLYRISTLEDPPWDKGAVRETANLLEIIDRLIDQTQKAAHHLCPNTPSQDYGMTLFGRGVRMVQSLRQAWAAKLTEENPGLPEMPVSDCVNDGEIGLAGSSLPDILPLDGFDDAWMMEFLAAM